MAGPTPEQNRYLHDLLGIDPDSFAPPADTAASGLRRSGNAPGGAAPPAQAGAAPWSFSPLKPTPPSLNLDPNFVAAMEEARQWVKTYLEGNGLAAVPGADGQYMFAGKATPLDTVVKTTIAASALANLASGETARRQIDARLVASVIKQMLTPAKPADDAPADKKKKDDDDGPETTVEVTPQGVQTNIQFTVKLRAVGEDDPRKVILLPDVEITLHVGKDADSSSVEAQLNLVKVKEDVSKRLTFNGHVLVQSIEFKTGVSAEANMTDVALARIQKSVEVKVKAELEFKVSKAFSFSAEADAGQGGVSVGPKLIFHF